MGNFDYGGNDGGWETKSFDLGSSIFKSALFGGKTPPQTYAPGSALVGLYGAQAWSPNMAATDRLFTTGSSPTGIQTYGIFDQARYWNKQYQGQIEGALQAAGAAEQQGYQRAFSEVGRLGASGYQRANDLETRLLSETKAALEGSGFWSSSMQAPAAQYALEQANRARLQVDSTLSGLYTQLHLGQAGAAADTYRSLAGFYESARSTAEDSFMAEFQARMGQQVQWEQQKVGAQAAQDQQRSQAWSAIGSIIGAALIAW